MIHLGKGEAYARDQARSVAARYVGASEEPEIKRLSKRAKARRRFGLMSPIRRPTVTTMVHRSKHLPPRAQIKTVDAGVQVFERSGTS